ncbi:restriction endonuclease subunit S [Enterococcus faecium]|uniref:restriction endonuclease subunit S n=1 Tax=Enterococcus faecium TaxID=1352 RepID=UPI0035CA6148
MSNDTQPEIRFPGFTGDWEQRKLGDEFEKVNERNDGSFGKDKWISVAKMYFQDPEKVQSNNIDTRTYVMRLGDIAFEGHPNADFKFGRFVVNDIGEGVVSELFPIYRHKQEYDNNYWKYAIQLERIMAPIFAKSITSSGNSSNKLYPKHFLRQRVSVASIDEQHKIGDFLLTIDRTIALHQRKLDLLKETKKGFLQKMFPKNGAKVPEIRFPGFTEDWEQRKLGDLGSVAMNKRIFKDQTSDNGEVPFFKIGTFGSHPDAFISRELFEEYKSKYPYPEVGDILISASGSIGRTVVYQGEDEYFQDSNIVWLKHNGRLDNKFLQQFYSIVKWQGLEGSTIKRLYNKNILDTNISVPTLDEQNKLGAFFEQLDDTIALQQRKLDLLKETKKGFLQKMFV